MLEDVLLKWGCKEVSAIDVYTDMFFLGDGYIQKEGEPKGAYKANPIAYFRNNDEKHGHYRVMFEDQFEKILTNELQTADFCILNGITYFGRKNVQKHASKMYAMIFDIDGVTDKTLHALLNGAFKADVYPIPNYIVLSGSGVHLYYLFEEPLPLYPNIKLQLKEFKYALTEKLWNPYTSIFEKRQMQGINQGFRVIGGKTKENADQKCVRAFLVNTHPFNLDQLGRYVPKESRIDESKLFKERKLTLSEAKKKYPEWYNRVILGKDKSVKRWEIENKVHGENPYALYDWWIRKIKEGASFGHRYYCVMGLAIYASKCNIPEERLKKDAYGLIEFLNDINPDVPFVKSDVKSALDCYDLRYCTFPLKDIEKLSDIQIKRNKRNGRKQELHLKRARAVQMIDDPEGEWRNKDGRPVGSGTKEQLVKDYIKQNPEASVSKIAKDLGISRTTVYKYLDTFQKKETIVDDFIDGFRSIDFKKGSGPEWKHLTSKMKQREYDKMRKERLEVYKNNDEQPQ